MSDYRLTMIVIFLGIGLFRLFVRGDDWYDAWFGGRHYGWFDSFHDFGRYVVFVGIIAVGLTAHAWVSASTAVPPPSYEESTPIKNAVAQHKTKPSKSKKTASRKHSHVRVKAST